MHLALVPLDNLCERVEVAHVFGERILGDFILKLPHPALQLILAHEVLVHNCVEEHEKEEPERAGRMWRERVKSGGFVALGL